MAKVNLVPQVDMEFTKAQVSSQRAADSINNQGIVYTPGLAYFVPRQYAHAVPTPLGNSNRFFAAEMKMVDGKLEFTGNLTAIKLSTINQSYLGVVGRGDAPVIKCKENEQGAMRPIREQPGLVYTRTVQGAKGIRCEGLNPIVTTPMIYWADENVRVYVPTFDPDDHETHTMVVDDDDVLQLAVQSTTNFHTEGAATYGLAYELTDILPAGTAHIDELLVKA